LNSRDKKLEVIRKLFYREYSSSNWNDRIRKELSPKTKVLEIGAGSGKGYQNWIDYTSICKYSLGIDLDPRVSQNPNFHETSVTSAYQLEQFSETTFDLLLSNMVAEHIDDADKFIEQQLALMGSDSKSIHHTVSKFYYSSLLNYVIPESVKYWLIEKLGSGRPSKDVFPALYKLNSKRMLRALSKRHGCEIEIERYRSPPGYLRRSYILMMVYVIIDLPVTLLFPAMKPGLIFTIKKRKK